MTIRLTCLGLLAVIGCASSEPAFEEVTSELSDGQGESWQGESWQGESWQGESWQGTAYDGTSWSGTFLANASHGGSPVTGSITETALKVWKHRPILGKAGTWEERFPNRICYWNFDRTVMTSCVNIDLKTTPSPLAGVRWRGTFRRPDATTFEALVQVGASTTDLTAVKPDPTTAMHALDGHTSVALCPLLDCDNPEDCRTNCDLWNYDVRVIDILGSDGLPRRICAPGEIATALPGIWDSTGTWASSTTQFTFACTSGVITKCLRWGYRPYGSARAPGLALTPLAPYHQACVRAAAADYCGNGQSFTKNGTLVDIWDPYFVPRTKAIYPDTTAYVWEGSFKPAGGFLIDHLRYQESSDIEDPELGCPGEFEPVPPDNDIIFCPEHAPNCLFNSPGPGPLINIESSTGCAHSEQTVGKWLHGGCSTCTDVNKVPAYCLDPFDARGWDVGCVQAAQTNCTGGSAPMAIHGECTTGAALSMRDTGCTAAVCLDPATASCCSANGAWNDKCVAKANAKCRGGIEGHYHYPIGDVGFCGTSL